jgi:hypothetical protein
VHGGQEIQLLANIPHVTASFELPAAKLGEQSPLAALFLLDSGAAGIEVIFHARAVKELQLQSMPHIKSHTLKVHFPAAHVIAIL